jgi:hypothetical protein
MKKPAPKAATTTEDFSKKKGSKSKEAAKQLAQANIKPP